MCEKGGRIAELEWAIAALENSGALTATGERMLESRRTELARLRNEQSEAEDEEYVSPGHDPHDTNSSEAFANSVAKPAPVLTQGEGSEPVEWQYRYRFENGSVGDWNPLTEKFIANIFGKSGFDVRTTPPPLPAGNADPRVREALEAAINQCEYETALWSDSAGEPARHCVERLEKLKAALSSPQSQGLVEAAEALEHKAKRIRKVWQDRANTGNAILHDDDWWANEFEISAAGFRVAAGRASDRSAK